MKEMPKAVEVWVGPANLAEGLRDSETAIEAFTSDEGWAVKPTRCLLLPVGDGFAPGDRVWADGQEAVVVGPAFVSSVATNADDYTVVQFDNLKCSSLRTTSLTRIDPDPPEERAEFTEEQIERVGGVVRDALFGNHIRDAVVEDVKDRLRSTEGGDR